MKIFINSYNRAQSITTPALLDACNVPYTVVLHDLAQAEAYNAAGRLGRANVLVANQPVGMTHIRNWLLETQVREGEWYIILDDNITSFEVVMDTFYDKPELPVKLDPKMFKQAFEKKVDAKRFMEVMEESRLMAEKTGANLVGFASNVNFFFRSKKWRDVGYVIGKTQLIRKTKLRYEPHVYAMDDYLWTAQNLEAFGKVLINNYAVAIKKHYAKGGIGEYEDRLKWKVPDAEYLMKRFPGLFRYKVKKGCHPKAELQIRYTNREQIAVWRKNLDAYRQAANKSELEVAL